MVLRKIYRKSTKRKEYALLSRETNKPLRYFGTKKPGKAKVIEAERIIEFYKHKK